MEAQGLYSAREHDACGVGFIADIKGRKSRSIVNSGLQILVNLTHRGAVGADPLQGDGAGILIQIPDALYRDDLNFRYGLQLPPYGEYGVGMIFLPQEAASRHACCEEIERAIAAEGQILLGWRDVPVDTGMPMSPAVREKEPVIRQVFVGHSPDVLLSDAFERKLYLIRKRSSIAIRALNLRHCREFYIPSFSSRTVVYKGQLLASQVGQYYKDLSDSRCESALAVVHQRFSTNTFPQWSLAHPFRMIAHNGEINTLRGNFNWIQARQKHISSPLFGDDLAKLWPLIFKGQSDSASFDNAFELLTMSGYSLAQAVMLLIPEAWEQDQLMDPKLRAFYEYHAPMMEPWDGPAAMVFTDGRQIGAALDRNGLRPARYVLTADGKVILASESGTLPLPEKEIVKKWRLEPGRMLLLDLEQGRIIDNAEIKTTLSTLRPYQEWTERLSIRLKDLPAAAPYPDQGLPLNQLLGAFGGTRELLERIIKPMAQQGREPLMSMGNDAPLAVLSGKPRPLYSYFRQMFAQVTNPPIDPIREKLVTSLISFIGPRPNLLDIMAGNPPVRLKVEQPILTGEDMAKIREIEQCSSHKFRSRTLDITYPLSWGADGIEARLASLKAAATDAVSTGINILIVSDRAISPERVAIPALLALSVIHQSLVEKGLRTSTGLIVETGSAATVHQLALLAGYGADAICPYAALQAVRQLSADPALQQHYLNNYISAADKGLNKIMAKMGICTYMSYCGAQIFEAVGLDREFIDSCFANTPSAVEGIGLFDVAREAVALHRAAFAPLRPDELLPSGGLLTYRPDGEEHMWTPDAVVLLQRAVRENDFALFERYSAIINERQSRLMTLRALLSFRGGKSVPLDKVDSEEQIMRRFATAAMSLGSISTEAHCTLAAAMNRIGGMSNSGEGGEDPRRLQPLSKDCTLQDVLGENAVLPLPLKKGDSLRSRVRQVASGRFGVSAEYLAGADLIQIKMAQGAKPGEGGQLPGDKVSPYIGYLRHALPGVGLISPPPHHDIYSIEDLAQLIYDLKLVNPRANISVKLVAQHGVGTVAAGVAKCRADHIVISGHDGGTGAAPVNSVECTGSPWEIGLSEVQQTLVLNKLRSRVRLQVDGQIKTGRDVVIGAILGADEFGFGTAPLVCLGCTLMRKCQKNTCPAGIATQDPKLRGNFRGRPEHVIAYFRFVAREVRQIMADLGVRHFDDLIGHTELLVQEDLSSLQKAHKLSLSRILFRPDPKAPLHQSDKQLHEVEQCFDYQWLPQLKKALQDKKPIEIKATVKNTDRAVGAYLSGHLAAVAQDIPADLITLRLRGTAGQSCGAFLMRGVRIALEGEVNDYAGKGLSGGRLEVSCDRDFAGDPGHNVIAGNTCLYGALSGQAFFGGIAGERFAVRNSGAAAVAEGAGDHCCEYMTGGTVVILGPVGRNFAAGMSGGVAYVYDPQDKLREHLAAGSFKLSRVVAAAQADPAEPLHQGCSDEQLLRTLLTEHVKAVHSQLAAAILQNFAAELGNFYKVFPQEYRNALLKLSATGA